MNIRRQRRRAGILGFFFIFPWGLAIKDGIDPVLLPASPAALFAAYLLGLAYYCVLSQLTLSFLPAFRERLKRKAMGLGPLIAVSAMFAVVPMWEFPTFGTELLGRPETTAIVVYGKSSGQYQRHACRYNLAVFPLDGRLTRVCVSKREWADSAVGARMILRGKRSIFGYVVGDA